ncbi:carbohydrate ABC transporter substrate-binding protein (CUT1 family) [Hydrogenoanaerobacterium saccharovorans]|uniref:Carbohydrate ABC transporter substrate-binding protein, CUT1 family n=1 Tax=Hydrogenoanaerobacterium saccharovorans TaxID=474960 RepID=A0A1H8CWN9_9FIRM|nr:extracellular solute-binding protein [Hydrogenoanaerobacterium saccharovorans]RPF43356.1 carbohydrate ABC transporter substrate-binding protein (CUT1 family) [Hydrogenoanaerobacterium saccharovorans]SEM99445.1 carbohydrate ABC transporter substrate-binding protein, CUT1 family [Hydrogenoanaerobacterium saccharovorans]
MKAVRKVAALALVFCLFAGCGINATLQNEDAITITDFSPDLFEDQTLQYFTDHPVNDGKPITLTMWVNEDWGDSYTYLLREYAKYRPNVTIQLVQFPWKSYWTKMRLALQNGNGPDIFHMHNSLGKDFLSYMEPLSSDIFNENNLSSSFSHHGISKIDGKLYFISLGSTTGGIFYNKELWRRAGLTERDIPVTWEQLRAVAKKLTQYDASGNIVVDGFNFNNEAQSLLFAMQAQKGVPLFSEDGQRSNLCNPENIENINFLRKLCNEDKVCRVNEASAYDLLGQRGAAMIYGWPWGANHLEMNYPTVDYGFFRIPAWSEKVPPAYEYNNYETSFAINRAVSPAKKQVAEDLLLFYLSNDNVLLKTAEQAKMVPTKTSLMKTRSGELGKVIQVQATYIDRTAFKGILPQVIYAYLSPVLDANMADSTYGISELLHATDKEIDKILKTYEFDSALEDYKYYNEFKQ